MAGCATLLSESANVSANDESKESPAAAPAMARTLEQIRDELLVLAAQGGDAEAFETLIRRWRPVMVRHAWRLTGDRDLAADVGQESCLAIVRGLGRLHDPAAFGTWVLRIVSNKAADRVRRRRRERRLQESAESAAPGEASGPAGVADPGGLTAAIREAVGALPMHLRAVVGLYYGEGLSVAEAAVALGIPAGTIKSRLHDARRRVKDSIQRRRP